MALSRSCITRSGTSTCPPRRSSLDINVDGKPIKAVALPTKQAFLYVFDRVTGQPVWPIEERPVPQTDVPGEKTSPTQPFPTKPPAYSRNGVVESDLIDFTPELKAAGAAKRRSAIDSARCSLPPLVSKVEGPIAALTTGTLSGGVNWPGSAYDPGDCTSFFAHVCNACIAPLGLVEPPADFSDLDYVMGTAGQPFRAIVGGGEGKRPMRRSAARGALRRLLPPPAAGAACARPRRGGRGCGAAAAAAAVRRDRCRACRSSSRRTACSSRSTSTRAS